MPSARRAPRPPRRPEVVLSAAMSLDGRIATRTGESRLSSGEDLRCVHALRASAGAVLVGSGTVLADDPRLTARRVGGPNPLRAVVDGRARTPPTARVLDGAAATVVYVSEAAPTDRVAALRARCEVVVCGSARVDLDRMLSDLASRGVRTVMLEGGGGLNAAMLGAGLVDRLRVTVAPCLIGGLGAVPLVGGEGVATLGERTRLALEGVERRGDELTLSYRVVRPPARRPRAAG